MRAGVLLRYLWAFPATAVGLALAAIACLLGATARVHNGVLEVAGGLLARAASALPRFKHVLALTLGHVVLGISHELLDHERPHEHAHVRQYERWGLLLFPLYLASSIVQFLRGGHPYRDNRFERQAFAAAATEKESPRLTARAHDTEKKRHDIELQKAKGGYRPPPIARPANHRNP